jgi:hypothetical protein
VTLTSILIAIAAVAIGYFIGVMRPTGFLSQTRPKSGYAFPVRPALTLFALGMLGFTVYNGWSRLATDIDGKVIARQELPKTPQNHGAKTVYTFEHRDGTHSEYTADGNDASLPQTFPIGASLVKRKWELGYTLNGQRVDDFPIIGFWLFISVGLAVLAGAAFLFRSRNTGATNRAA